MRLRIWIALIAVYIAWGSTYLAIRFAVETMPPFLMAASRFIIAGGMLYAWRRLRGDPLPTKIEWQSAAIVGAFLVIGGNGGVVLAMPRVNSSVAALIVASAPLWMVLIDAIRPGGRRPNLLTTAGVLFGFLGIVLLIGPLEIIRNENQFDMIGVSLLLLAAFFWAVGSLYSRNAPLPSSALMGTGMEMLAGAAGLLVLATLTGEWARLDLAAISTRSWLGWIYLIIFGALVGFVAYTWLLRVAPTPLVSTYAYVNPLIAIFMGYSLAQEPLTPHIIIAATIIISSVALINIARAGPGNQRDRVTTENGKPA